MHFRSVISTFALLATAVTAQNPPEEPLIGLWRDKDFQGAMFTGFTNSDKCHDLPGDFNNNISSGKSLKDGFLCTVWDEAGCTGAKFYTFTHDGNPDFSASGLDRVMSWRCYGPE